MASVSRANWRWQREARRKPANVLERKREHSLADRYPRKSLVVACRMGRYDLGHYRFGKRTEHVRDRARSQIGGNTLEQRGVRKHGNAKGLPCFQFIRIAHPCLGWQERLRLIWRVWHRRTQQGQRRNCLAETRHTMQSLPRIRLVADPLPQSADLSHGWLRQAIRGRAQQTDGRNRLESRSRRGLRN